MNNAWRPQNRGYRPYQPRYNQNYIRGRNPHSQNYDNGVAQNTTYRNNYSTSDARGNWDQNSSTFNQNPGN